MSRARTLWPKWIDDSGSKTYRGDSPDYEHLVALFGTVIHTERLGGYQGDFYTLLRRPDAVGFLKFGYGSCSGCDALEGCDSYAEMDELIDRLESQVVWMPSSKDLAAWLTKRSEDNTDWDREEFAETLPKLLDALKGTP